MSTTAYELSSVLVYASGIADKQYRLSKNPSGQQQGKDT